MLEVYLSNIVLGGIFANVGAKFRLSDWSVRIGYRLGDSKPLNILGERAVR